MVTDPQKHTQIHKYKYKIKTYNAPYVTRVIRRRGKVIRLFPQTGPITIHCPAKLSTQ